MSKENSTSLFGRLKSVYDTYKFVRKSGGIDEVVAWLEQMGSGANKDRPSDPYSQVVAVYAAITKRAESLASLPLMISTLDDRVVEDGPLFDLIQRPNERMSARDFWRTTEGWLSITGACHWIFIPSGSASKTDQIVPVGGKQMRAVIDKKSGELVCWKYRRAGTKWEQAEVLPLDEVWTVGNDLFDADNPYVYLSPLQVAGKAIDQVHKSELANEASLDNGVTPGGFFTMPEKPDEKALDDIKRTLRKRHEGVKNRQRSMILHSGMDWKQTAASFGEMEFTTLQKMKIVDICVAFGVDPAAIGYYEDSNYAHASAAKAGFWLDTMIPHAALLADEFYRGVVSRYVNDKSISLGGPIKKAAELAARKLSQRQIVSPGYQNRVGSPSEGKCSQYVWFDVSGVDAVRDVAMARIDQAVKMVRDLLATPAAVIKALDLPLEVTELQNFAWATVTQIPLDPNESPVAPGSDDDSGTVPNEMGDDEKQAIADEQRKLAEEIRTTDAKLSAIWQKWRSSWSGIEKTFQPRYYRHMQRLRDECLKNLSKVVPPAADDKSTLTAVTYDWIDDDEKAHRATYSLTIEQRDLIGQILFSITAANKKLLGELSPLIRAGFQLGGQQTMDEAAKAQDKDEPDLFNIADPNAAKALRQRTQAISYINQRTTQRLRASLAEGLSEGETHAQLAERIRHRFKIESNKARTIAFQEVSTAVETARDVAREQAGVKFKSWLWSRKENGRPLHAATERDTLDNPVPAAKRFTISGTSITCMHPRSTGYPEQDINCGCTTISRFEGDGIKQVLDDLITHGFTTHEELTERQAKAGTENNNEN